jgi:tRNA threonylcarbamoyladenosine biosynthesis protein TsaE
MISKYRNNIAFLGNPVNRLKKGPPSKPFAWTKRPKNGKIPKQMKYPDLDLKGVRALAKKLAGQAGNKHRIFGLVGPLGAGKTAFTQAMAQAMGAEGAKSPTFTLVHCYQGRLKSLYHMDLYRLEKEKELDALGLDDILADGQNVACIEWADKFPSLLKKCDTIIKFEVMKNDRRNVTVTSN